MYELTYLRTDTVRASEELAQGHIASGFKPLDWKAFRNASHEVRDPGNIYAFLYCKTPYIR